MTSFTVRRHLVSRAAALGSDPSATLGLAAHRTRQAGIEAQGSGAAGQTLPGAQAADAAARQHRRASHQQADQHDRPGRIQPLPDVAVLDSHIALPALGAGQGVSAVAAVLAARPATTTSRLCVGRARLGRPGICDCRRAQRRRRHDRGLSKRGSALGIRGSCRPGARRCRQGGIQRVSRQGSEAGHARPELRHDPLRHQRQNRTLAALGSRCARATPLRPIRYSIAGSATSSHRRSSMVSWSHRSAGRWRSLRKPRTAP